MPTDVEPGLGPSPYRLARFSSRRLSSLTTSCLSTLLAALPAYAQESLNPPVSGQFGAAEAPSPRGDGGEQQPAAAQQTLSTVTVESSATPSQAKRLKALKEVPQSFSEVGGQELDRLQANDIQAIAKRLGNFSWSYGNQRTSGLSIRGLGKQGQTEAQDPSVGVTVDGVPYAYNPLISSYYFVDLDNVEVARGPQGTRGGKNSSLGTLNITTRRPSFKTETDWSATWGERHHYTGTLATGGGLIRDLLAWRGAFVVDRADGDFHDPYRSSATYSNTDRIAGRTQFLFTPSDTFDARLALSWAPKREEHSNGRTIYTATPEGRPEGSVSASTIDASTRLTREWFTRAGYSYVDDNLYGGRDGHSVNNDRARGVTTGSRGVSGELNWERDKYRITSISAWQDYYFHAINDEGTPFDIYRNAGGFQNTYKQISQEFRLSSQPGGKFDWQTGLYLLKATNHAEFQTDFGKDAGAFFANSEQYGRLTGKGAGQSLLSDSLDGLSLAFNAPAGLQLIDNKSAALFAHANWRLNPRFTLTGGLRLTFENRSNTGSSFIKDNGAGALLNPASVNGMNTGGFDSDAAGNLAGDNSQRQLALANQAAAQYFGASSYGDLTEGQKQQLADAKNIRATRAGILFGAKHASRFRKVQPTLVFSPSYKITDNLTGYLSFQHGEKAGISQITAGHDNPVKAEKTNSFELGFKSDLPEQKLILNADIYLSDIKNYQQGVRVLDQYSTGLANDGSLYYTTATGNVPKVRSQGLEIDGLWSALPYTDIRFAAAYTDARYRDFPNAAQPLENNVAGAPPYRNVNGKRLPGASKYSANIGVDWRKPVFNNQLLHASLNTAYSSKMNADRYNTLSRYGWVGGTLITDLAVGLGRADKKFDVSLLVKNLFDDDSYQARAWNSYDPAIPRWFGVMVTGQL